MPKRFRYCRGHNFEPADPGTLEAQLSVRCTETVISVRNGLIECRPSRCQETRESLSADAPELVRVAQLAWGFSGKDFATRLGIPDEAVEELLNR